MTRERLIVCTSCGAANRLPSGRTGEGGKCGKCATKLFSGKPADVNGAVFQQQIERSSVPVLVDVWAPWCGPCQMMASAYEQAASALEPEVRLIKLNSDNEQSTAAKLGIRGIPTLLLFDGGREIGRSSGAMAAGQIIGWVRERLPAAAA